MKGWSVNKTVLCVFPFLACLIAASAFAADKVVILRAATYQTPSSPQVMLVKEWAKEVEEKTGGRVKITIYPSATLVGPFETYEGVTKGVADIGNSNFSYSKGRFPMMECVDLPHGLKTTAVATHLINDFNKRFKPKELDDVKVLWLEGMAQGRFHTRKPIRTLEDMRGVRIRSNAFTANMVKALGGTPVGLPISEAYEAISKGICDGITTAYDGLIQFKLDALCKYHTLATSIVYTAGFFWVMNKEKWQSIPPDAQKIIDAMDERYIDKAAKMWAAVDADSIEKLKATGHTFIPLSPQEDARWGEKMKPIFDDYVKMTKEKGVPGEEALNWVRDYLKKNDR
jgi:TRAP-type C4-dicarboxylate transport system substrate-binding protein